MRERGDFMANEVMRAEVFDNNYIVGCLMKKEFSAQGLSEIIEESDRDDFDNPRHMLAKLSNL
jgi:hypothetical protein